MPTYSHRAPFLGPKGPKVKKMGPKMDPFLTKCRPKLSCADHLLVSCFGSPFLTSQGALLGPRWATEARFGTPKALPRDPRRPQRHQDRQNSLVPPRPPRTCEEPAKTLPRTCQEPAGQRLYPRTFLGYTGSVAPTRSQIARCQDQGAAVPRPLAVFNN